MTLQATGSLAQTLQPGAAGGGRPAHGFPGDRAEAAGSCAAIGHSGTERLGVELEEEGFRDEEEDAARAMEREEAGAAVGSSGAREARRPPLV